MSHASHCEERSKPTYSITEVCPHDIAVIRTLTAECGCETTAEFCIECQEQLTKPKTEC